MTSLIDEPQTLCCGLLIEPPKSLSFRDIYSIKVADKQTDRQAGNNGRLKHAAREPAVSKTRCGDMRSELREEKRRQESDGL